MDTDNLYFEIFSSLRKIIKAVDIYSLRLKEKYMINSSQLSCLLAVADSQPVSLSSLSKVLSLSRSMITVLVDQLENNSLVIRKRSKNDRRVILIELTEKGNKTLTNAPLSFQNKLILGLKNLAKSEVLDIKNSIEKLLSVITSEVLYSSDIMGVEDKLIDLNPELMNSEIELKKNQ